MYISKKYQESHYRDIEQSESNKGENNINSQRLWPAKLSCSDSAIIFSPLQGNWKCL